MAPSPLSWSSPQLPTSIDTAVPGARKIVKRRKLDLTNDQSSPHCYLTSSSFSPDQTAHVPLETDSAIRQSDAGVSSSACTSCRRAIARSGSAGVNMVVCARCRATTCVICARKCEGPASLASPSAEQANKPAVFHVAHSGFASPSSRRTRRLPLRANVAATNQESARDHQTALPVLSQAVSHSTIWPTKHDSEDRSSDEMRVEDASREHGRCAYGTSAIFCKACVMEYAPTESTICLGCSENHKV